MIWNCVFKGNLQLVLTTARIKMSALCSNVFLLFSAPNVIKRSYNKKRSVLRNHIIPMSSSVLLQ